ncbi:DNA (cytosine-5-)-methyltransferase [Streptomyces sp. NPDC049837]|uniref:DNA cytosine methyltransferase n=1 Tax=Streptomyces sp. NPDC049837 TaxID=3155277 RepID=UPI00342741DE
MDGASGVPIPHDSPNPAAPACVEICAGAGGQALGLERAGFAHTLLVELDADACRTLRANRPAWNVLQADIRGMDPDALLTDRLEAPDLLAAGVPCPPFSLAGKQLGCNDERDLLPAVLALAEAIKPRAVLIENVKGLLQEKFREYRSGILQQLRECGYAAEWRLLNACDFGVAQLRPRAVLIALPPDAFRCFKWPEPSTPAGAAPLVGDVLHASMASGGWELADSWAVQAQRIAPTLCGGSRKHGGPDLGPSRARRVWAEMGVNGAGVADAPPSPGDGLPVKLTIAQMALLQGFPPDWVFEGRKTSAYRQVGNAFPPPVAQAVGQSIMEALVRADGVPSARTPEHAQRRDAGVPM